MGLLLYKLMTLMVFAMLEDCISYKDSNPPIELYVAGGKKDGNHTVRIENGSDVMLICQTSLEWPKMIRNEQNQTLNQTADHAGLIYVFKTFRCSDSGKYTCLVKQSSSMFGQSEEVSIYLTTQSNCPLRLCHGVIQHQNIKATLGSNSTVSVCIIFDRQHESKYSLYVNDQHFDHAQGLKYHVELINSSPLHVMVSLTVRDVAPADLTLNTITVKDSATEETVFSYNFTITAEESVSGGPDVKLIIPVTIGAVFVIVVVLIVYRYMKGVHLSISTVDSGKYQVRPRLSTSASSNSEDHYDRLEEYYRNKRGRAGNQYLTNSDIRSERLKYQTLSNNISQGATGRDFQDWNVIEYITPSDGGTQEFPLKPQPCGNTPKHSRRQHSRQRRDAESVDMGESLQIWYENQIFEYEQQIRSRCRNFGSETRIDSYNTDVIDSFINNPLYDDGIRLEHMKYSADMKQDFTDHSVADELADIERRIVLSVKELDSFERTLTRPQKKHQTETNSENIIAETDETMAPCKKSVDVLSRIAEDDICNSTHTIVEKRSLDDEFGQIKFFHLFGNNGNVKRSCDAIGLSHQDAQTKDDESSSSTQNIRQYFQKRIDDDEFMALIELIDYVKRPDTT
ncbi:hypothetical protein Bpfe_003663 [Biomphalaria pfeifferi]|uniref:Ig-like domain-containing protein n=1 Tax=Biomphalaria pfeifferi TaxID=112525 RepID=A0AAD8C6C6_BIOPF|nr:hypothetical protein Bpfe_003663 [Biomphalaria pfeifferi]